MSDQEELGSVADASLVRDLLQATIDYHAFPGAQLRAVDELPIGSGMSGAEVRRYAVAFETEGGGIDRITLVTKLARPVERRVLALLNDQDHRAVPFAYSLASEGEGAALICLQDVGDVRRPVSLDPIPPEIVRREASGLAAIHAANVGRGDALSWLPVAGVTYVHDMIEERFFRPAWERSIADPAFVQAFGSIIAPVETAAAAIVSEMAALDADGPRSLVHTDVNPSNVLISGNIPFFIDWDAAHYGSVYLDLPHHLPELDQAERYRLFLARHGVEIPPDTFAQRFRVAARYTGLRYIWWALDAWREDHGIAPWVRHYLRMILGDDLPIGI